MIRSVSSSAAWRPLSGMAPQPRPLVSLVPICSFMDACELRRAWMSVLAAMNSTPPIFAWIMRLTALTPAPPMPMTLILAGGCRSSSNLNCKGSSSKRNFSDCIDSLLS